MSLLRHPIAAIAPPLAILLALCAALYLPGIAAIHPVDRDECRFAQASRQMFEAVALPKEQLDLRLDENNRPLGLHAGGLAVPMLGNQPRLNKPPLIYWLQATSAYVFTGADPSKDQIWMYRLPSAICATLTVLLTFALARQLFDPRCALLIAAILAASPMLVWDAHQARSDQLLLLTTTATMACMWNVVRRVFHNDQITTPQRSTPRSTWLWASAMWACLALGILSKGFITPMILVLTIIFMSFFSRNWRWITSLQIPLGILIVAAILTPWLYAIHIQFGVGTYAKLIWEETFLRAATGSKEGHFAPPGFHLVLLSALFWPGSLLTLWALKRACQVAWGPWRTGVSADGRPVRNVPRGTFGLACNRTGWRGLATTVRTMASALKHQAKGRPQELFLLGWIVPSWIVFEISLAKLPHYTLPMFPAIALLSGRMIFAATARHLRADVRGVLIWCLIGVGASVAVFIVTTPIVGPETTNRPWVMFGLGVSVVTAIVATAIIIKRRWIFGQALGVVSAVMLLATTLGLAVVHAGHDKGVIPGWQTNLVADVVHQGLDQGRPVASLWAEDSMRFVSRSRVVLFTGPGSSARAGAWIEQNPRGLLVVGPGQTFEVPAELRDHVRQFGPGGTMRVIGRKTLPKD